MQVVAAVDVGMVIAALVVLVFVGSLVFNIVDKRRNGRRTSAASNRAFEGTNSAGQDEASRDFGHGSGTYPGPFS